MLQPQPVNLDRPTAARLPVGFPGHLIGAFYELLFIVLIGFLLAWLLGGTATQIQRRHRYGEHVLALAILSLFALYSLSDVILHTTPGKWLLSLHVRDATGSAAPLSRHLLRWAVKASPLILATGAQTITTAEAILTPDEPFARAAKAIAGTLTTAAGLALVIVLGGTLLALGPDRRPLHDRLAGTALFRDYGVTAAAADYRPGGFEVQPVTAAPVPPAPTHADSPPADASPSK
jgi:hypothetical protein